MSTPYRHDPYKPLENTTVVMTAGVMGAGKTASLINVVEQLEDQEIPYIIIKPDLDTTSGRDTVSARDGRERQCYTISTRGEFTSLLDTLHAKYILVDEAQFFSPDFIDFICETANDYTVGHVLFYALKNDYLDNTFPSYMEITDYASKIYWLERKCEVCGDYMATHNLRVKGGDSLIEVDKSNYKAVCFNCYHEAMAKKGENK